MNVLEAVHRGLSECNLKKYEKPTRHFVCFPLIPSSISDQVHVHQNRQVRVVIAHIHEVVPVQIKIVHIDNVDLVHVPVHVPVPVHIHDLGPVPIQDPDPIIHDLIDAEKDDHDRIHSGRKDKTSCANSDIIIAKIEKLMVLI